MCETANLFEYKFSINFFEYLNKIKKIYLEIENK